MAIPPSPTHTPTHPQYHMRRRTCTLSEQGLASGCRPTRHRRNRSFDPSARRAPAQVWVCAVGATSICPQVAVGQFVCTAIASPPPPQRNSFCPRLGRACVGCCRRARREHNCRSFESRLLRDTHGVRVDVSSAREKAGAPERSRISECYTRKFRWASTCYRSAWWHPAIRPALSCS